MRVFGFFVVVALAAVVGATTIEPKNLNVALKSSWNATSILSEASEFYASYSNELYWKFLDEVASQVSAGAKATTDQEQYKLALAVCGSISGASSVEVLKFSLSIKNFSPKVAMYQQIYPNALKEVYGENEVPASVSSCSAVVFANEEFSCGADDIEVSSLSSEGSNLQDFDHIYTASKPEAPIVVLYADFGTASFSDTHKKLSQLADDGSIKYVVRPFSPESNQPIHVQGFGVELAIKNMEYKVMDDTELELQDFEEALPGDEEEEQLNDISGFVFSKLLERKPESNEGLKAFREELLKRQESEVKPKVWNMKNLGFQASQRILTAADPLVLMRDMSQNFPMYASALTRVRLNKTVKENLLKDKSYQPGTNLLQVNGITLDPEDMDLFALHDILHREGDTIDKLSALGLSSETIQNLLSIQPNVQEVEQGSFGVKQTEFTLDMTDNNGVVTWLNDLESGDEKYEEWAASVSELTGPGWPNQLRYVRRNLHNAIVVADPSKKKGLAMIQKHDFFVDANAPLRGGIAFWLEPSEDTTLMERATFEGEKWEDLFADRKPSKEESVGVSIAKVFHYLRETEGLSVAVDLLKELASLDSDITFDDLKETFETLMGNLEEPQNDEPNSLEEILELEEGEAFVAATKAYIESRGFKKDKYPVLVLNGAQYRIGRGWGFRDVLMRAILTSQNELIPAAHEGRIDDSTDFNTRPYESAFCMPRLSDYILKPVTEQEFVSSLATPKSLRYVEADSEEMNGLTHWVVTDLSTEEGLDLASAAVEYTHLTSLGVRVALMQNPSDMEDSPNYTGRVVSAILSESAGLSNEEALKNLRLVLSVARNCDGDDDLKEALLLLETEGMLSEKFSVSSVLEGNSDEWVAAIDSLYLSSSLLLVPGELAIITNGRINRIPQEISRKELISDFGLLSAYESQFQGLFEIREMLEGLENVDAETILAISYVLCTRATKATSAGTELPDFNDFGVIQHDSKNSMIKISAILDPLSKAAQKVTPVLIALRESIECDITVILNPQKEVSEYPLQRFYRYAVSPKLTFDKDGQQKMDASALFRNLHTTKVLTLQMATPESWVVEPLVTPYDLDNINLKDLGAIDTLNVQYLLSSLLISGQCMDTSQESAPAGLQLVLSTALKPHAGDTLVMQNLGYFQLKAQPGLFKLYLERSAQKIYQVQSKWDMNSKNQKDEKQADGDSEDEEGEGGKFLTLAVTSFNEPLLRLNVERKSGMETVQLQDVMDEADESGSMWDIFGSETKQEQDDETVHVFSIASGWLYERFLKIMMLSVINNTDAPVKFWFISNFLSPQFKEFAPKMAEEYGYEVEFVTYKWPFWLRRQTEKQRIIWGYKILFLDVMFPINLKRVIYIDADQVVRGDVKELADMDLNGAPYAYTPFCSSNKETNGFRFWDSGYWKNHLRGKPYHISALYVVDLQKFREVRAGDQLRSIYDSLSADPNSLANLDQDLPNYAQHQVKIHSLPQEWLWCQTWCSMDTLETAKTIDLCNNPLTKTPKLEVARTLLPEWTVFDDEAKALEDVLPVMVAASVEVEMVQVEDDASQEDEQEFQAEALDAQSA